MAKISSLLEERFRKKETPKMAALAEQRADGDLSSFAGIFGVTKMGEKEQADLASLLHKYAPEEEGDFSKDLSALSAITSEVKAINNQAALLHGERIKRAQSILKKYREGAFTAWLMTTYGNRQTPYNFLQYYEFHSKLPSPLITQIESMPRQAVYTLASREGDFTQKEEIVRSYKGESKQILLELIRQRFPLSKDDKRSTNFADKAAAALTRIISDFGSETVTLPKKQKQRLIELTHSLQRLIKNAKDD